MVSSGLWHIQLSFFVLACPSIRQFCKNGLFFRVPKLFHFPILNLILRASVSVILQKHYKIRVVRVFVFVVSGVSEVWVLVSYVQKWPFADCYLVT